MTKRLYVVDVSATAYVVADSEEEAARIARAERSDILAESEWVARLNGRMPIPRDWRGGLPYGDDSDERTVEHWREVSLEQP